MADENQNPETTQPPVDGAGADPAANQQGTSDPAAADQNAAAGGDNAGTTGTAAAAAPATPEPVVAQEPAAAPAAASFLQALEAEVKAAEKAGSHAAHAVLNDIHLLLTQVKAKAAAGLQHLEGDAAEMVQYLHRGL